MNARASAEISAGAAGVGSLQQLGDSLRDAREAKGVNVEEAAARLRLAPKIIRSIEEGDFDQLPAATYARGYLRAYANFLGLTAEPLLQAYERYAGKPPELNPFASAPPPQVQASDLPVRAMTYTVVAIVLGLLGAWLWQTQQFSSVDALSVPKWGGESGPVAEQPVTEPVQTVPVASPPQPPETPAPVSASSPPAAVVPPAPTVATAPPPAPVAADAATPTAVNAGAEAPTPATDVATATPGAAPRAEAVPSGPEAALAVNAPGMQVVPATGEIPYGTPSPVATDAAGKTSDPTAIGVATGPQALSFDLAEDSWIEVYDADSKRLYYNIGRQGTRVSVQGALPYRVKVGNAPAVLVSYQGHSLDITAFSNGSVARFQVTPDGFLAQP